MPIQAHWDSIALDQIHDSGQWNLHPFITESTPDDQLNNSLNRSGIIHPPVVRRTENGYELLAGRRRLHCLSQVLEQTECCCRILPADTEFPAILHIILTDQQTAGPLSPMEQAYFLLCCQKHVTEDTTINIFLPRLGRKTHRGQITTLLRLLELDPVSQHLVHEGLIHEAIGFELLRLERDDQIFLSRLFENLSMGHGKQKRFLALCKDLSGRSSSPIRDLFNDEESKTILENKEMNPPQKTGRLLEMLQKRSLPRSSAAEKEFRKKTAALGLPSDWHIQHSLSFERDEVSLTIPFASLEHCAEQLPALNQLLKK
ncbi:MAG: ParB N-terminal domain-containing protein [Desulfobulbaceae bacterium]|uniref:ParB N-terminal domain-containing protein n=1 Tax=Candidatus Desulfatifera sulfidica TaxID=2841691 RepID=A0A8J6T916_9BACT|nr:ParB N-terminal domain-containing protein [Candidatus Desulfatifera sulfidica]